VDLLDAQQFEPQARAHDVGDGIHGPHFVEVNALQGT